MTTDEKIEILANAICDLAGFVVNEIGLDRYTYILKQLKEVVNNDD